MGPRKTKKRTGSDRSPNSVSVQSVEKKRNMDQQNHSSPAMSPPQHSQPYTQSPGPGYPMNYYTPQQQMYCNQQYQTSHIANDNILPPPWAKSLIDDMRDIRNSVQKIDTIETTVNVISNTVSGLENKVQNVERRVNDIETSISFVADQNDQFKKALTTISDEIKSMKKHAFHWKRTQQL